MTRSESINLAKALISPFFGSMATRNSRAGPTAFLAAVNNASSTAATRTSRLMPFSRSQNSKTAKKSAFILFHSHPYQGNKKVGRLRSSDFGALASQQSIPLSNRKLRFFWQTSQAPKSILQQ